MTQTAPHLDRLQRRPPGKRRAWGVCNQKGGAGKTTTVAGIGAELARGCPGLPALPELPGRPAMPALPARPPTPVRMLDMDPQAGSLTHWFPPLWDHIEPERRYDMADVLSGDCTLDEATWPTSVPNLYIVPSWQTLTRWANSHPVAAESALRVALERSELDLVDIIDCAPSLGLLTIAALATIDRLVVPLRASGLDLAGVAELNQTIDLVQERVNPDLEVVAVLLCGKLESKLTGLVYDQLREDYPTALAYQIRNTVRVQEAPVQHKALHEHAPDCTAVEDYRYVTSVLAGQGAAA